jgi:hypothetical protein
MDDMTVDSSRFDQTLLVPQLFQRVDWIEPRVAEPSPWHNDELQTPSLDCRWMTEVTSGMTARIQSEGIEGTRQALTFRSMTGFILSLASLT